jgi:hypothetical protein
MVTTTTDTVTLGQTYNFSITHSSGTWWNFEYNGALIKGTSSWENGTFNLNQTVASGFGYSGFAGLSAYGGPMQFTAELGNSSFSLPQISVPWAIGIEKAGQQWPSYRPATGNAMLFNTTYPIGIAGQDQNPALPIDSVYEAGSLTYPGTAAPLWGHASPLGAFTPQVAAYTTQAGVAGNGGMGFTFVVPSGFSLTHGQLEFFGVQMPINSSAEIGVGAVFSGTYAIPYYFVSSLYSTGITISDSQILSAGSSATLAAQAQPNGWWTFTENGVAIVNATENGTAYLGHSTAEALVGTVFDPSVATFGTSTFPMLGLFGNGTISMINVTSPLLFSEPGRGMVLTDYANGWCWNMTQSGSTEVCNTAATTPGIEGTGQYVKISPGDVLFGSSVQYKMTTEGAQLWAGVLNVKVTSSSSSLVSGQTAILEANVSTSFSLPSPVTICGSALGTCNLTFTESTHGTNWTLYTAMYVAPNLPSSTPLQVNVTVSASSPPDYSSGFGATSFMVTAPQLKVQVTTSPSTVVAGKSATISIWVNDSIGPISGAVVVGTVTPAGGQSYLGSVTATSTAGLYQATFSPPSTITSSATYTIVFLATSTGTLNTTGQTSISVTPLPALSVTVAIQYLSGSGPLVGGQVIDVVATVTSAGQPVSGVTVAFSTNASWPGLVGGSTSSTGVYGIRVAAPNGTTTQVIKVTASVSSSGYRSGTGVLNVTVLPTPSSGGGTSGNGSVFVYIIVAVVVVVVVVVALMFLMKRKKAAPAEAPPEAAYQGQPMQPGPDQNYGQPPQQ